MGEVMGKMGMNEVDYVPLSMINALAYCPRRFVYEFVQGEMLLNEHVVEGMLLHEGVDFGGRAWVNEGVQDRRVYVWSERLRLAGFCDVVEEREGDVYPVEYKKGRSGRWSNDHAQLCAQAMCLEACAEVAGRPIAPILQGAIFSFAERRREVVEFGAELRAEVERLGAEAQRLAVAALDGELPPPLEKKTKCRDCSLQPLCLPDEVQLLGGVRGGRKVKVREVVAWEDLV
jgi:CRISPR-associated exonuclease Cas4